MVDIKVGIDGVIAEIVLFEHRVFEFVAPLLNILNQMGSQERGPRNQGKTYVDFGIIDLERMNVIIIFIHLI